MTRTTDAKTKIILAAEELFGMHGVNGVSLRQICQHARQRNIGAVQYHFGDRDNLIREILTFRRIQLEQYRRELFDLWKIDPADSDLPRLFLAIIVPWLRIKDTAGNHSFVWLLNAIMMENELGQNWLTTNPLHEFTSVIMNEIRERCHHIPDHFWGIRVAAFIRVGVGGIVDFDRKKNIDIQSLIYEMTIISLGIFGLNHAGDIAIDVGVQDIMNIG